MLHLLSFINNCVDTEQTTIQIITDIELFNIPYRNKNVFFKIWWEPSTLVSFHSKVKLECIEFQKYYSIQSKKREPNNLFNTSLQLLDPNIGIVTKTIAKIQWCRVSMTSYKIYISTMNHIKRLTGNQQTLNISLLSTFSFRDITNRNIFIPKWILILLMTSTCTYWLVDQLK